MKKMILLFLIFLPLGATIEHKHIVQGIDLMIQELTIQLAEERFDDRTWVASLLSGNPARETLIQAKAHLNDLLSDDEVAILQAIGKSCDDYFTSSSQSTKRTLVTLISWLNSERKKYKKNIFPTLRSFVTCC